MIGSKAIDRAKQAKMRIDVLADHETRNGCISEYQMRCNASSGGMDALRDARM